MCLGVGAGATTTVLLDRTSRPAAVTAHPAVQGPSADAVSRPDAAGGRETASTSKVTMSRAGLFAAILAAATFAAPSSAYAQVQRGMIHGVVRDATGAVLPGAALTLTSTWARRRKRTPDHLESSASSTLTLVVTTSARLDGCAVPARGVIVGVGAAVELVLQVELAERNEEVLVTTATPCSIPASGNVNFDQVMLNEIPTARDPGR